MELAFPITTSREFKDYAHRIRYHALNMIHRSKGSHVASAFSSAELLAVLYGKILRIDPARPDWPRRDRFILSKGHACAGLYVALAERGFFPRQWLDTYALNGSHLAGHVTHFNVPGVEASTGSLGHGLPIACGMSLAGKYDSSEYRVFVLLGDGECDEGSVWEAAAFAAQHALDNLVVIVDYNRVQSAGNVPDVCELEPFVAKWESFRWQVTEVDGHRVEEIESALSRVPLASGRPSCILAHTVKGKGVSFMEHQAVWHNRSPQGAEFEAALEQIGAPR